jgi:hypothetical protein
MLILGLIVGCFIGVFIGVATMCFCFVARTDEEQRKGYYEERCGEEEWIG